MSGIVGVAIDQLMQTRAGRWAFLVAIFVGIFLAALTVKEESIRREAAMERREASQRLWLSECTKPIDECATAWDASYTLRELYRQRVGLD